MLRKVEAGTRIKILDPLKSSERAELVRTMQKIVSHTARLSSYTVIPAANEGAQRSAVRSTNTCPLMLNDVAVRAHFVISEFELANRKGDVALTSQARKLESPPILRRRANFHTRQNRDFAR